MKANLPLDAQALKSLSDRSPYDAEELLSRLTTLPASVAVHLSGKSDVRRKFKKSSHGGDPAAKSSGSTPKSSPPASIWAVMEEFFRPITADDVRCLIRDLSTNDPSFSIPGIKTGFSEARAEKDISFDVMGEVTVEVEVKKEEEKVEELDTETPSCSLTVQEVEKGEEEEEEGMSWLLGSKHRVILTTERSTKKRKLLGTDAGLDRLLLLPHPMEEPHPLRCDVCYSGSKNQLVSCTACSVCIHRKCYGLSGRRDDSSLTCSWCKHLSTKGDNEEGEEDTKGSKRPCVLCPRPGGALKPVEGKSKGGVDQKFAHLFCCMWTPEAYVEDTSAMEPIMNVGGVQVTKMKLVCNVCKVKHGACVRCSFGACRTAFHPICAREARHQMEIWGKLGCNNVELRVFCAKHSTSQDTVSAQHLANLTRSESDDSSVAKPSTTPLMNKIPKLRFSRNKKDKSTAQTEVTDAVSNEVDKNKSNFEQDAVALSCSAEDGDVQSNKNVAAGVAESDKSLPSASHLILLFKKLIGRGKIIVGDVASDIGIPFSTLEEALSGETSTLSSELRLNITKWLQNSIHMPASTRHLKFINGSANLSGVAKVEDPDNVSDCRPVKSPPPCRRTKSNISILKDDDTVSSSGEILHQSCKGKLVNDIGKDSVSRIDDVKEDATGNMSAIHHQDHCCEHESPLETIEEETCPFSDSDPCQNPDSELKRTSAKVESNDLCNTRCQPHQNEEDIFMKHGNGHADEANIYSDDIKKKERLEHRDDKTVVYSATPDRRVDGSCSSSCVHPYIRKRLMQVQSDVLLQQKSREADSNDLTENQVALHTFSGMDPMLDVALLDELDKSRNTGILELSPEDEVGGEMLYLQNRLVDNSVAIKHSCEDVLGKIVQRLPPELDALKKQRWDLVLVNQYLREVREAKKRGRKETKHKEAQAVLAAAAAAAAASPRNPLLRKDSNDENPLNVSTLSARASRHSPLGPRVKETPRPSFVKVSPEKCFGIPECSKENELSCDICRRPETLLNRIFVCSNCKVAVHLDCYHKLKDPIGPWKCELCEEMSQSGSPRNIVAQCWLCGGGSSGAFRKSTKGQWVHAFCAEWLLESAFRRGQLNHVDGMDAISKEKDFLICAICHKKYGVCSKCSYGNCQIAFHPLCARAAGMYMNVKAIGGKLHHKAYCEKHSLEQRQKADKQQYGAEELKNIKQIRVGLEKVRLLCERIIKREKVKRDLVLCSHDILASKRDYVAFSVLVRSSFFPRGVSSESATTSIDNRSYSGIIQRSEDVTMDSTVSDNNYVNISIDMDRKTDGSSTSRPSFKRKIGDQTSFSGNQLLQRVTSVPVQTLEDDLERRFKPRMNAESFHKEVVMTSHQASMQNQRLPKGFAYVPVGYLAKEKPVIHDSESHEPEEPGG